MDIGGQAIFCTSCPLKSACEGPIVRVEQHTVDANYFSMKDSLAGVNVGIGTRFYNQTGRRADYFPPGTTLNDIIHCTGQEIDYRFGFLNLRAAKNCGAFVAAIHRFRRSFQGSPYPKKR